MSREAVGVFEEARSIAMVVAELDQEDGRRVWKALLPVDLEVQGKRFQNSKRRVNIMWGAIHPIQPKILETCYKKVPNAPQLSYTV